MIEKKKMIERPEKEWKNFCCVSFLSPKKEREKEKTLKSLNTDRSYQKSSFEEEKKTIIF